MGEISKQAREQTLNRCYTIVAWCIGLGFFCLALGIFLHWVIPLMFVVPIGIVGIGACIRGITAK